MMPRQIENGHSSSTSSQRAHRAAKRNRTAKPLIPAIQRQVTHVKRVMSKADGSFGIERLVRTMLVVTPFVFPTLYVRHITSRLGVVARKKAVEFVVLSKLLLLICLVVCSTQRVWPAVLATYFMLETILYLLAVVLLADIYSAPISKGRSFTLLMINYIEVSIAFGLIHWAINGVHKLDSKFDAVYFSFVTSATLGYGDKYPITTSAKCVVIVQIIVMLLFACLFFINLAPQMSDTAKNCGKSRQRE